jgi:hypothetical protein
MSALPDPSGPSLRLVREDTGESVPFLDAEMAALVYQVDMLETQLKKAEMDANRWRWKHEELKRDKEAEARKDALWPQAVRLMLLYNRLTAKSPDKPRKLALNHERFDMVRPFLKKHGIAMCERAIVGRVFEHFTGQRANGSTIHYYEWERIFGNLGKGSGIQNFEESCNRAPLDFVSELETEDDVRLHAETLEREREARAREDKRRGQGSLGLAAGE